MLVWAETIRVAGLALSVIAMRTAIVIPVAASVVVWREQPTVFQLAGIGAAVVALALVLTRPGRTQTGTAGRGQRGVGLWLAALFTADGLVMLAAKVFREHMPQSENLPFQSAVFLSASFITTGLYYLRKPRVTPAALRFGAVLGAANLGNHLFLILALSVLPGAAVYPVIAAAEVGVLALAGTLVWKERVGLRGWLGIALAVLALILIQLGGPAAV
jgi:drug/metabolite transporter (DMT)-like permease